jgi:uncharacterized membrane protein
MSNSGRARLARLSAAARSPLAEEREGAQEAAGDEPAAGLAALLRRAVHALIHVPLPTWATPVSIACLGMYVVETLDHGAYRMQIPFATVLTGSLIVMLVALHRALAQPPERLVTVGQRPKTTLLMLVLAGITIAQTFIAIPHLMKDQRYTNDAVAVTDCAAQMVMHGANPYKNVHMLTCLSNHGLGAGSTTPKTVGAFKMFRSYPSPGAVTFNWKQFHTFNIDLAKERRNPSYMTPDFENRFNYPGAAISIAIPALLLGVRDFIPLYLGFIILACNLIWRRANPRIRLAVAVLLLGNAPLVIDGVGGLTDASYAIFLVLYWFNRKRTWPAALLLGLAVASRQQAWFFVPFLLFLAWRECGLRDAITRSALVALVFLGFNLQFIVAAPGDWIAGVLGPMHDPMFALGVGLIDLSIAKILPLFPATVYLLLEVSAYAGVFAYYTRRYAAAPALALLLPLVPMFFAWRSLHTYFMFLPILAVAALVTTTPRIVGPEIVPGTASDRAGRSHGSCRIAD